MMMDIDELLPEVLTHAHKCPEPLAIRYLRDAARDFCQQSRIWRTTDTIPVSAPDYEGVCTIQDAAIVLIESAHMGETALQPLTLRQLDQLNRGWATETNLDDAGNELGTARYITQLRPGSITLYPRQIGTITARLILKPSRTAMQIPDFLVEDYGREIAAGALGDILLVPGTEYVNPQLGAFHKGSFEDAKRIAGRVAARGQTNAPIRSKVSMF